MVVQRSKVTAFVPAEPLHMDASVVAQRPPGVVSDLPDVTVEVRESPGRTTPLCYGRRANDPAPCGFCLLQRHTDLLGSVHVVGELDPRRAVSAERGPEGEHHSSRLEETDLIIRLLGSTPPESLIEGARRVQILDAEGHDTDALIHVVHADTAAKGESSVLGKATRRPLLLADPSQELHQRFQLSRGKVRQPGRRTVENLLGSLRQ